MDGCIPRLGTIGSCKSAATSKIVKRCCSRVYSCKQRYIKTFKFTFSYREIIVRKFLSITLSAKCITIINVIIIIGVLGLVGQH